MHRDVKPANILVEVDSLTPKLVDFGVAPLQGTNITQVQTLLGTPHYMSPEQWRGEVADGWSDLFSLGASLPAIMQATLDPNTPVPPGGGASRRHPTSAQRRSHESPGEKPQRPLSARN